MRKLLVIAFGPDVNIANVKPEDVFETEAATCLALRYRTDGCESGPCEIGFGSRIMISRRRLLATIPAATAIAQLGGAHAQQYPEGRITIVVGFGAGGMTDITSRMLAGKLEKLL